MINIKEFKEKCAFQTMLYDQSIGREYNQDAIGKWVRNLSYYLVFICYRLGLKGQHILLTHALCDLVALYFVYANKPIMALIFWLVAHVWDNVDGALARIRNEAHPKWGELDVHLHLVANMWFWIILALQTWNMGIVIILGMRVINEWHRDKIGMERYGEKSRMWKWLAYPTNVNAIYLSYVPFAYFNRLDIYIVIYLLYFSGIAIGQSLNYGVKLWWK